MRHFALCTLLLLPVLCFGQKDKKAEKRNPDKVAREALLDKAESALSLGSLDTAVAAYSKALWMWPETELRKKLADVHLLRGDTTSYCAEVPTFGEEYRAEKAFYAMHCVREDSVLFAATGLDPVAYPNIISAVRTWRRAKDQTNYKLYSVDGKAHLYLNTTPTDTTYGVLDDMPAFPEGEPALFKFLGSNIRYPAAALDHGFSGVVYVTFIVDKYGSIQNAEVLRGVHYGLDAESLRVVRAMPRWKPGTYMDKPVRTQYNLPVRFSIR
ncbi:MAG: energy transducer TonB [Flavobacteriales bacterium]